MPDGGTPFSTYYEQTTWLDVEVPGEQTAGFVVAYELPLTSDGGPMRLTVGVGS